MTPPVMTIGGVVVTPKIDNAFSIQQTVSRRGATCDLVLYDEGNAIVVGDYATILVVDDQGNTLFSGWATNPAIAIPSPQERIWQVRGQDGILFLNSRAARKTYTGWFVTDIVRDLILNASPPIGITCNNTPAAQGPSITFAVNNGYLKDELARLAKLASLGTVWDYFVDFSLDLHFYAATAAPLSTVVLSDADVLPTNGWGYDRETFRYERDLTQIATSVTVAGGTYLSPLYTQTTLGDGVTTSFPTDFPPDITNGPMITMTVGGVAQTIASDTGQTPTTQWLLVLTAAGTYVVNVGTASAPGVGVSVVMTYEYDAPVLVNNKSYPQIGSFSGLPNTGTFDKVVVDTTLVSQSAANARAAAEISVYAYPYQNVHVEVPNVWSGANGIGSLAAGQKVTLINSQVPQLVSPGQALLIQRMEIRGTVGQGYSYILELQG